MALNGVGISATRNSYQSIEQCRFSDIRRSNNATLQSHAHAATRESSPQLHRHQQSQPHDARRNRVQSHTWSTNSNAATRREEENAMTGTHRRCCCNQRNPGATKQQRGDVRRHSHHTCTCTSWAAGHTTGRLQHSLEIGSLVMERLLQCIGDAAIVAAFNLQKV